MHLRAMPRRDAKDHEDKITLTANRIVQFTNQDKVPVVSIHWEATRARHKGV
jgi:hypothetical protein